MSIIDLISDWVGDLIHPSDAHSLADLGADPHQLADASHAADAGVPGPSATEALTGVTPGSNDAVLDSVQDSVDQASESYHEGMAEAAASPHVPSAGEGAQQLIDGVMHGNPDQIAHEAATADGSAVADEIHGSVADSQQHLADSNAAHEAIRAGDQAEIDAEGANAGAESAIDDAESAL
jgi:hypothetical protein